MYNIRLQKHRDKSLIFGQVVYEDGLPAKLRDIVLECICPEALKIRKPEKCRRCKLSHFNFVALTTTDENGNFIFVIKNRRLIYSIRVVNELMK